MIDLHLHSTASDGSDSPTRVVELASEAGCSTIALTDHDGLGGFAEARRLAEAAGIGLIDGCEVSCVGSVGTIHLLVYFTPEGGTFDRSLAENRHDRERRNRELLDKLRWLGMPLDHDELATEAGSGLVGRPHFAALLVRHGYATSITDAFDRFLAEGRPGYVERAPLAPETVLDRARACRRIVSLAHPYSTALDRRRSAGTSTPSPKRGSRVSSPTTGGTTPRPVRSRRDGAAAAASCRPEDRTSTAATNPNSQVGVESL